MWQIDRDRLPRTAFNEDLVISDSETGDVICVVPSAPGRDPKARALAEGICAVRNAAQAAPQVIYVAHDCYGVGPFFSSPEAALTHYRHHYRHASNAEQVAQDVVQGLIPCTVDDPTVEIDVDNPGD